MRNGRIQQAFQICRFLHLLGPVFRYSAGNRQDRTFLRFHNRLVSGFHRLFQGFIDSLGIQIFFFLRHLAEAAQQLG